MPSVPWDRVVAMAASLAVAALVAAPASAAEPAAEATHLAQEGLREFQAGHWAEAMALFEDSFRRRPSAKVQRGIAKCLFELRMYVRALAACDRALAEPHDALPEDLAEDVRSLRARALRFTREVVIEVTPPQATVTIDGQRTSAIARLELGTHSIRVEAQRYDAQVSQFEVVASEAPLRLQFDLHASAVPGEPTRPSLWPPLAGGLVAAVATTLGAAYVADRGGSIARCDRLSAQGSGCANLDTLERERALGIGVTVLGVGALVVCGYFVVRVATAPSVTPRAAIGATPGVFHF